MREVGKNVIKRVAGIVATFKSAKKRHLKSILKLQLNRNAINVVLVGALFLNLVGTAIPALVAQYNDLQARIPHPLASMQKQASQPAADAGLQGKATNLPESLKTQLANQQKVQQGGKSRNSHHVQTLDENRTATDRVYLNSDGTKSIVHSLQATSFKDAADKWKDVDSTLQHDQSNGKWHTKANSWEVIFGDIANDGVQIAKNGKTLTFRPVGGKNSKPDVSGNGPSQLVTYRNVWQGVDLQYKVGGSELKESIIIKSRSAQSSFDFATSGASITAIPGNPSAYSLGGAFAGFTIAAATVGTTGGSSIGPLPNVAQSVTGGNIKVALDTSWLSSQATASFPIIIDPTVLGPSGIGANYQNYSSAGASCSGTSCGGEAAGKQGSLNWRSAFQTNLSTIPAGQFPLQATLHLDVKSGSTAGSTIYVDHSQCQTGFTCYDSAWGESSGSVGTTADLDVTNVYIGAMAAGNTTPWMMIRGVETGGTDTYKQFDGTTAAVTITYEALPTQPLTAVGSPADNGIAISTQPTFFTSGSTDSDGPNPILYRYIIGTGKNVPAYNPYNLVSGVNGVIVNSGQIASKQWTAPDNVLQDGTTYYWQMSSWDGLSGSPETYSPVYSFKVDLRNGKDNTQAFDTMGSMNVDLANGNLTTGTQSHSISALGGSLGVNLNYNSPQASRQGLVGTYYNDPNGTRTFPAAGVAPNLQRVDPNVDFDWGGGSPYTGIINNDNFLVRWAGFFVAPQDGTYQFGTSSDDGSRIFLNGSTTAYLDQWSANPNNVYGSTMTLTAGQMVPINYEYYEAGGLANAHLLVKTSDLAINGPAKATWLQTGVRSIATPHGLVGRYYTDDGTHNLPNQDDPTRLFLTRTDTSLAQNWGFGSPVPNGPADNFMVRWSGYFTAPANDTYAFGAASDDGVRITINNNNTVLDNWVDRGFGSANFAASGVPLTAGQTIPITVDYYEHGGWAQMALYAKRGSQPQNLSDPTPYLVDSNWLTPQTQVLPDGWNLSFDADGNLNYDYATTGLNSVTLRDSKGQTHEYKFAVNGFTPPPGEDGHMVRNSDGTITFQDSDGRTYIFNRDGTLKSSTRPTDDRNPTGLQYIYAGSPAHITQISDAVTQTNPNDPLTASRWAKVLYAGDANCPSVPSGFTAYSDPKVAGMICAITTSDGTQSSPLNVSNNNVTRFLYVTITHPDGTTAPFLSRAEKPGNDYTDYGFDVIDSFSHSLGRIASARDTLANDAVTAGQRTQDGTETTQIQYDALGHVSSATVPAAAAGATRMAHSYNYYQGYTYEHVTGATEPNGFTRKVLYDSTYRTTDDYDVANLDTKTKWHPGKDLVQSTTDPTGLMSTTLYDYDDRATDQYGPAPSTWFDTNSNSPTYDKPLTTPTDYTPQVPHKQTAYDGSIAGLAAAYYNVDTYTNGTGQAAKALFGAPTLHTTGVGPANGDVNKTWGATPPFTPATGKGWGTRLSGFVHFTTTGNYTFRVQSDDGVRVWLDDQLIIDDWNDGTNRSHGMVAGYAGFNNTADSFHRVRLDYYNKSVNNVLDTDAALTLFMTPPGSSETSALGGLLNPGYGLKTNETSYDSSSAVGNTTTTTNYGSNPELGLAQTSIVDPTGLALTTSSTYETQGVAGSFLRQTSKTLPGGVTTNYSYYGGTETRQNPCDSTQTFKQAGRLKLSTEPDPDGAGPQTSTTTESVYDDAGRVVASRFNTEAWKCAAYDARSRTTQVSIPAQPDTTHVARSARTITYNYAVGGNPLQSGTSDTGAPVGPDVEILTDLLGRTTDYNEQQAVAPNYFAHGAHYTYDNLGRLSTKAAGAGTFTSAITETYNYDNLNRISNYQQNGTTYASPTYDAFGRLNGANYSATGPLAVTIGRDSLGRTNNYTYTVKTSSSANPTQISDAITVSQSGQVISGIENGAAKAYTYDKGGRLTNATLGTHSFAYNFGAPASCTGTYNANAGKNANRTSSTIDGVTKTYCYDYADRLVNSSDTNNFGTVTYDAHGNIASGSSFTKLEYDSSDRSVYVADTGGIETSKRDPFDRTNFSSGCSCYYTYGGSGSSPNYSFNSAGNPTTGFYKLPGGITSTLNVSTGKHTYSLPNIHSDTMATVNDADVLTTPGSFQYDPFGLILGSSSSKPSNGAGTDALAYLGQSGTITDTNTTNRFMQMGARLYVPSIGRFAQVDPVEGGLENNYVYPPDPVNDKDLTGKCPVCEILIDDGSSWFARNYQGIYQTLSAFTETPFSSDLRTGVAAHQEFTSFMKTQGGTKGRYITDGVERGVPDAFKGKSPVELKPDNPRAIRLGLRQLSRYERITGKKGQLWVYRKIKGQYTYRRIR